MEELVVEGQRVDTWQFKPGSSEKEDINGSAQSLPTSTLSQSQLRSSTKPPSFKVLDKPLQQEHLNLTPHGILITND
ncbi:hypothetical protein PIB30_013205 [Stylosanthes scabra]|uniref:Uncharacterized protein n=1 Tax=Stylosanthes scabra TaxID=79078 RepID=A0ABU6Q6A1_9FABA|nr:hypothetical protein [Stylosanthes scabra]